MRIGAQACVRALGRSTYDQVNQLIKGSGLKPPYHPPAASLRFVLPCLYDG